MSRNYFLIPPCLSNLQCLFSGPGVPEISGQTVCNFALGISSEPFNSNVEVDVATLAFNAAEITQQIAKAGLEVPNAMQHVQSRTVTFAQHRNAIASLSPYRRWEFNQEFHHRFFSIISPLRRFNGAQDLTKFALLREKQKKSMQ
jgi:hypothetical protein